MIQADQIQSKWLPECLVLVPYLPKGPTGKPKRIGLAKMMGLPALSHRAGSVGVMWRATVDEDGGESCLCLCVGVFACVFVWERGG